MDVQIVTHEVRLQKWIGIVTTCRSSGKTIKAWCDENGINLKSYYYWQRKVCLETCREIATVQKSMPEVLPVLVQENHAVRKSYHWHQNIKLQSP